MEPRELKQTRKAVNDRAYYARKKKRQHEERQKNAANALRISELSTENENLKHANENLENRLATLNRNFLESEKDNTVLKNDFSMLVKFIPVAVISG